MRKHELYACWPFNLALTLFGDEESAKRLYIPELDSTIQSLGERKADVLYGYYRDGYTMHEIADSCGGITRERVRQLKNEAECELKEYRNMCRLLAVSQDELARANNRALELERKLEAELEGTDEPENKEDADVDLDMDISKLGLSERAHNALARNKIRTVSQLTSITEKQLLKLHGVGDKIAYEIKQCLEDIGINLYETD